MLSIKWLGVSLLLIGIGWWGIIGPVKSRVQYAGGQIEQTAQQFKLKMNNQTHQRHISNSNTAEIQRLAQTKNWQVTQLDSGVCQIEIFDGAALSGLGEILAIAERSDGKIREVVYREVPAGGQIQIR